MMSPRPIDQKEHSELSKLLDPKPTQPVETSEVTDGVEGGFPVTRETRVPFGSRVQKLASEKLPGFHDHWFNDVPGRLDKALTAGYKFVMDKAGQKRKHVVGLMEGGQPMHAYLMRIPQEWYDSDMAEEQKAIDEREDTIRRGAIQNVAPSDQGKYFNTAQGRQISIKHR